MYTYAPRVICVPTPVSIIAMCYRVLCGCYPCVYRAHAMCVVIVGGLSLPLWLVVRPLCVCVSVAHPSVVGGLSPLRVWLSLIHLWLVVCPCVCSSSPLVPLCVPPYPPRHRHHCLPVVSVTVTPISLFCFAMHWHSALLCSALSFVSPVATLMCLAHDTRLNPALGMGPTVRVVWHVRRVTSLSHGRLLCAWCGRTASALFFSLCLSLSPCCFLCLHLSLLVSQPYLCVSAPCVSVHLVSSVLCVCVPALYGFVPPCLSLRVARPLSPHTACIYIPKWHASRCGSRA
jgi:hypothetical protein